MKLISNIISRASVWVIVIFVPILLVIYIIKAVQELKEYFKNRNQEHPGQIVHYYTSEKPLEIIS